MRPVLPENKKNYKLWIVYIFIFLICIMGIGVSMYMQYFQEEKLGVIMGITDSESEDEDEYNELKNNLNNIFTNNIQIMQEDVKVEKIREDYDIVVSRHTYNEEKEDYTLNVSIPNINIKNEQISTYNEKILNTYKTKVEELMGDTGYIYDVRYKAYIQNNILSLIIHSELKEKDNNQKIMIETYNYDLNENREVTLEGMLEMKNITKDSANTKIKKEIEQIEEKNKSLTELGYTLYKRDLSSDMYKVENIKQYFQGEDGSIYVIFPYGNYEQTSEMDIVIFKDK
ncbi:MAG: hypothetical protein HFJ17_02915 [Clostridia bacterium]|nr:hypothetical protein [Clostridia bacterium]